MYPLFCRCFIQIKRCNINIHLYFRSIRVQITCIKLYRKKAGFCRLQNSSCFPLHKITQNRQYLKSFYNFTTFSHLTLLFHFATICSKFTSFPPLQQPYEVSISHLLLALHTQLNLYVKQNIKTTEHQTLNISLFLKINLLTLASGYSIHSFALNLMLSVIFKLSSLKKIF